MPAAKKTPDNSKLPPQFRKLVSLQTPLGDPRPGDWLASHVERGQDYADYISRWPVRPSKKQRTIYIQPLGDFTATGARLSGLRPNTCEYFFSCRCGSATTCRWRWCRSRRGGNTRSGATGKSSAPTCLTRCSSPRLPRDATAMIAFTASDLWPGEGWNFVFGQASLADRVGVWSVHRFGDPDKSDEAFQLALRRTLQVATHGTGHMFSMEHCVFYECLMCGSNNMDETDRQPLWLCPQCLAKLCYATGAEPRKRFKELIAFAKAHGLEREEVFWQKSLAALQRNGERP